MPLETEDDNNWPRHADLIVAFVALQLCVGIKYTDVLWTELRGKIRGVTHARGADQEETDSVPGFPRPTPRRFLAGTFQERFETAARENFPGSKGMLLPVYRSSYAWLSHGSLVLLRQSVGAQPLWGGYNLVGEGKDLRLCGEATAYHREDRGKLADRAAYYNQLSSTWPNVRFHVFSILGVADWCAMDAYGEQKYLAGETYAREFRNFLNGKVGYGWAGEGSCPRDVVVQYYRTDHHLNISGMYQAYRQVCGSLSRVPLEPKRWAPLLDLGFRGSYARRAGYFDELVESVEDGIFDLPEQTVRICGFEARQRNAKCEYWAGKHPRGRFANHYAKYFGIDYGLVEYSSAWSTTGNLLVISDSFDNCIEPLLAAHFSRTWFVDLRLYAKDVGEEFDLDQFLSSHEITNVLFLGSQYWVLGLKPLEPYE